MNSGIDCPICGKYKFDDFSDYDACSVCGWKINITQYDDHDFSNGTNALSVNEYKLEYKLLSDPATAERAKALREEFLEAFHAVRKEFREGGRMKTGITCEESRAKEIAARESYAAALRRLETESK